jgi:hypothetical protein
MATGLMSARYSSTFGVAGKPAFAYAPGIGIDFDGGFGFGIRYEAWVMKRRQPDWNEDLNQVPVRVSYAF